MQRPSKFSVQQKLQDFTSKIEVVLTRTACAVHGAIHGEPCYTIGDRRAVCGSRSKAIFTGTVSSTARYNKRPKKEHS